MYPGSRIPDPGSRIPSHGFHFGHFGKYHNTLCLSPQILHKHCFQFLLGLTMIPRENKQCLFKIWRTNREYYGLFQTHGFHRNGSWIPIEIRGFWIPDSTLCIPDSKASHCLDSGSVLLCSFAPNEYGLRNREKVSIHESRSRTI